MVVVNQALWAVEGSFPVFCVFFFFPFLSSYSCFWLVFVVNTHSDKGNDIICFLSLFLYYLSFEFVLIVRETTF